MQERLQFFWRGDWTEVRGKDNMLLDADWSSANSSEDVSAEGNRRQVTGIE